MASVVCVLVKICVSSISLYKLDTDKLTSPFESAHQFTLVGTVSDSCHDRDSPSMLDPPPMIEFLELHACSVRIEVSSRPQMGHVQQ